MKEEEIECKKCGQCCWYEKNDRKVKCKYLKYNRRRKKCYCSIYTKRKFMLANGDNPVIDFYYNFKLEKKVSVIFMYREQHKKNYPGCPYNCKKWENENGKS